ASPAARKLRVSKSSTSRRDEDSGADSVLPDAYGVACTTPVSRASSDSDNGAIGESAALVAFRSSHAMESSSAIGGPRSDGGETAALPLPIGGSPFLHDKFTIGPSAAITRSSASGAGTGR